MFTVIIKVTNGCNLACSYCSLGEKKDFKYVNRQSLLQYLCFACDVAILKNETDVNIIFHGGEPTLITPDIYKGAIDVIRKKYLDLNIRFSMQSNGFIITDEMIEFLLEYDVHMGISMDGALQIHDLERKAANGAPTYEKVVANINRLQEKGVQVACLMVLTHNAIGKGYEYIDYFAKNNIHLKINPLLNYGEASIHPELSLQPGEYAAYLIGLFEYIICHDIEVSLAPIDNILQAILGDQRICECTFHPLCNQNFLCIDYKGDVYPCGKFSDMNKFKLGNVREGVNGCIDKDRMQSLVGRRTDHMPLQCMSCKYLHLCNAGCSAEAVIEGLFESVPVLCEDYKILFDYFHRDGLILLKKELQRQRQVLEAEQIWTMKY